MMDRSELVRSQNDTLLDEFQQRLNIQIRRIDLQIAMLNKEIKSLTAERYHLAKFFPDQQEQEEAPPAVQHDGYPKMPEAKIPNFLAQGPK
jgi:hypothetical protein